MNGTKKQQRFVSCSWVVAAFVGLGLFASVEAATIFEDIELGDKLLADVIPGVEIGARFDAVKDTLVDLKVKPVKGSTLTPTVALKDDLGNDVPLGESLSSNSKGTSVKVKKFPIPATGTYYFLIGAGATESGSFDAKTKGKFPKKYEFTGTFPADDTLTFDVMPGSTLKGGKVKADKGQTYEPTIVSVADDSGALTIDPPPTAKGATAKFKTVLATAGGTITWVIGGANAGTYTAKVKAKAPKPRKLTIDRIGDPLIGTLAGTVVNDLTDAPIEGAAVTLVPPVLDGAGDPISIVTDAAGAYSADIPPDDYDVTIAEDRYDPFSQLMVTVAPAATATVDARLTPVANVIASVVVNDPATPNAAVTATVTVEIFDGSTVTGYAWAQSNSVTAVLTDTDMATVTATLPDEVAYRDELVLVLIDPIISQAELPPEVEIPPGGEFGGLQSRFEVAAINPFSLEEAGALELTATVTTSSGDYDGIGTIHTELPWKVASGLTNVPTGIPVLLQGKDHVDVDMDGNNDDTGLPTTYDWALAVPGGSAATLSEATSQNPWFTPDIAGQYTVTVTNTTELPGTDVVTLDILVGDWVGVIDGQDANGDPTATACTGCHNDTIAPDQFTEWSQSGHAHIFSDLIDTSTHYGENCFPCHSVGFDTGVANGGFDDASDYANFIASGLINTPGDNWATILSTYPETAQRSNIQCENCHGPQSTAAHTGNVGRISLSSDLCAQCHGEPLRHARFQQWQLSGHANYELAIEEGESGNCSRCHTANGFLTWFPVLNGDVAGDPLANITVTWTADETHPQTCVVCHDPHSPGTMSGDGTDVQVRITDNTPPLIAGFTATDVGSGAMCMTCHNTRRGLRNDTTWMSFENTSEAARAPHGGAQADVLMGENAYFVTVGTRGAHADTMNAGSASAAAVDTCVTCHMVETQPPEVLAYNDNGANHTFYASETVCASCHGGGITAGAIQAPVQAKIDQLQGLIETGILDVITAQTTAGNKLDFDDDLVPDLTDAATIQDILYGETRGRQAITITLVDTTVLGPFRMNDIDVLDPTDALLGELFDSAFTDDRLWRSGWNYNLAVNDSSTGVHNNAYVSSFLDAAIAQMQTLNGGG